MTQMSTDGGADSSRHWMYGLAARLVSLIMALAFSAVILIYPKAIAGSALQINHAILSLLMWGIAAGFIHGVGYIPKYTLWRIVFGPLAAWSLMGLGLIYI